MCKEVVLGNTFGQQNVFTLKTEGWGFDVSKTLSSTFHLYSSTILKEFPEVALACLLIFPIN